MRIILKKKRQAAEDRERNIQYWTNALMEQRDLLQPMLRAGGSYEEMTLKQKVDVTIIMIDCYNRIGFLHNAVHPDDPVTV